MKKIVLVLAVMLLTAPLYAGTITFGPAVNNGPNCTIPYTTSDPAPVAMGLDVDCSAGVIDAVAVDSFFDIYMDDAYDLGAGYTYGAGEPIAEQAAAGGANLPLANFCISMGGLGGEVEPLDPAPSSGVITLDSAGGATGQLTENALRGGVIDVDGNAMTVVGLPLDFTIGAECPLADPGHPDNAAWLEVGSPECWCYLLQCFGDADNVNDGALNVNKQKWVIQADLDILVAGWQKKRTEAATLPFAEYICASFDRNNDGALNLNKRKWVTQPSLDILVANWQKKLTEMASTVCPGY